MCLLGTRFKCTRRQNFCIGAHSRKDNHLYTSDVEYRIENSLGYEYICYSLNTTLYRKPYYTDKL